MTLNDLYARITVTNSIPHIYDFFFFEIWSNFNKLKNEESYRLSIVTFVLRRTV